MTTLEIRDHNGAPTLFVDGAPQFAAIYLTVRNAQRSGAEWQGEPHLEAFRDAGFHFYSIENPTQFDDTYDPASGEFPAEAFAPLDVLWRYIELDPQARFLLRVGTEPRGERSAWILQHPDECEVLETRAKGTYLTPSFASDLWRRDAAKYLRALIGAIQERGLAEHILGYLVCGGDSAEWVKVGPMEDWAGDYSRPMQQAFGRWLCDKYGDAATLRQAWADPSADFGPQPVPTPSEQAATDLLLFKDPRNRRKAIDYFQFLAHLLAQNITYLCGVAKEACHRQHLVGVFFGYLQEIVWNNGFFGQRLPDADTAHTAAARSGHAGLAEVLASPDVDFCSSPYSYGFRGVGGEGGFMSPEASVRRAGKLWISEEDMRTHLWPVHSYYGQTRNTRETVEVLKRQVANIITHAAGGWWCDWGNRTGGAYAEPEVMSVMRRAIEVGNHHVNLPDRSSAAEVAIVIDAENWFYRSTLNNFDIPNWRQRAWGIARMGAPVDAILLSDLLAGRARGYKLYYFLNTFYLTAAQREALKNLLRCDDRVALWMYAPGLVSDDGISAEHCYDLTGINLQLTEREWGVNIFINQFEHPITAPLPTSTFWGTDTRLGPVLLANDPHALTLGTAVTRQGRCEPGFVLCQFDHWASLYSAAPNIPPGVLREIARYAGVHIFSDSEDVLYADHNYVAVHTVRSETKTIRLPHRANVWEVFSNRQVGQACAEFSDRMEAGTTSLYYYGPAPRP